MKNRELKTGDVLICVNIPKSGDYKTGGYYPIEIRAPKGGGRCKDIVIRDESGNEDTFQEGSYFHTQYFQLKKEMELPAEKPAENIEPLASNPLGSAMVYIPKEDLKKEEGGKNQILNRWHKQIGAKYGKGLFYVYSVDEEPVFINNYDFFGFGNISGNFYILVNRGIPDLIEPADMKEVIYALTKEAERRGYKDGIKCMSTMMKEIGTLSSSDPELDDWDNEEGFHYFGMFIMNAKGEWGEIIKRVEQPKYVLEGGIFDLMEKGPINEDLKDNKIELLKEDLECVHLHLDDLKVPRKDESGKDYSIVGRIDKLISPIRFSDMIGMDNFTKKIQEQNDELENLRAENNALKQNLQNFYQALQTKDENTAKEPKEEKMYFLGSIKFSYLDNPTLSELYKRLIYASSKEKASEALIKKVKEKFPEAIILNCNIEETLIGE
jgi:hypothetical protein